MIYAVQVQCMQFRCWKKTSAWVREFEIASKKEKKFITVGREFFSDSCRFLQKRCPFAWRQNCTAGAFCLWSPIRLKLGKCQRKGKLIGMQMIEKWNGECWGTLLLETRTAIFWGGFISAINFYLHYICNKFCVRIQREPGWLLPCEIPGRLWHRQS